VLKLDYQVQVNVLLVTQVNIVLLERQQYQAVVQLGMFVQEDRILLHLQEHLALYTQMQDLISLDNVQLVTDALQEVHTQFLVLKELTRIS